VYYGREEILKCRSVSLSVSLQIEGENRRERNRESERLKEETEEEDLATTKDRAAKVCLETVFVCIFVYFRVFSCFFLFWRIKIFSPQKIFVFC
jgi:hypothetical protein